MRSREGYFGVYVPSCAATREINTKITLELARKLFVTKVHTFILFLTRNNEPTNDDKTTIFINCPYGSRARSMFCRWRHNRLRMMSLWPDNCDAITWIVIYNSLDIDFLTVIFTAGRVRNLEKLTHISWGYRANNATHSISLCCHSGNVSWYPYDNKY